MANAKTAYAISRLAPAAQYEMPPSLSRGIITITSRTDGQNPRHEADGMNQSTSFEVVAVEVLAVAVRPQMVHHCQSLVSASFED